MKALIFFVLLPLAFFSSWKIQYEFEWHPNPLYIPPPPGIQHFAFGMKPLLADSLWIRAIQDFDVCESKLDPDKKTHKECNKSWLYQVLDRLTDLDSKFRLAYSLGATSLSLYVGDKEGASALFDKGTTAVPTDWIIPYRGAYHAIYETNDQLHAAELLKIAGERGAPAWTFLLAGKILAKGGGISEDTKRELGEAVVRQMIEKGEPEELIQKMRKKVEENVVF